MLGRPCQCAPCRAFVEIHSLRDDKIESRSPVPVQPIWSHGRAYQERIVEEKKKLFEQLMRGIYFVEGLQDMQAMPSPDFDRACEEWLKEVKPEYWE